MSEIRGIGLDLCEIARMRSRLEGRFMEKYFTEREAAYIHSRGAQAAQSMAGVWAAKEAVLKALGTGIAFPLREVEITHTEAGQPLVQLHGKAAEAAAGGSFLVSITHEGGMAAAVALWYAGPNEKGAVSS